MWSQIAAWAPTSTPRVGWEAISSTGSPLISRPTISFCWLPPESARACVSMPGVRTSYSSTMRWASSRAPRAVDRGARLALGVRSGGRGCGSPTAARRAAGRAGAGPRGCSRCRRSRRSRVCQCVMSWPARRTVPVSGWRMPMIVSTSSAWPLPSTPAMPSTSPLWMVSAMSASRARPNASSRDGRVRRVSRLVGDGGLPGLRRRQLGADHQLGQLALGDALAGFGRADGRAAPHDGDVVGDRRAPRRACGR